MAARVEAQRPGDFPAAHSPSDNHFFAVIKKIALFAVALFASVISFSLISIPIATAFSAIVLLSSLTYMLSGSTSQIAPQVIAVTPEPVYIAPPPTFWSFNWVRPTYWTAPNAAYIPVNRGHNAPVGTGQVTPPCRTTYAPAAAAYHVHRGPAAPATGAASPLNRYAQGAIPPTILPGGAPQAHAPVGRR